MYIVVRVGVYLVSLPFSTLSDIESAHCVKHWISLYPQAIDGVNKGQIKTEDKLYELKALQESNKSIEVSYITRPVSRWYRFYLTVS